MTDEQQVAVANDIAEPVVVAPTEVTDAPAVIQQEEPIVEKVEQVVVAPVENVVEVAPVVEIQPVVEQVVVVEEPVVVPVAAVEQVQEVAPVVHVEPVVVAQVVAPVVQEEKIEIQQPELVAPVVVAPVEVAQPHEQRVIVSGATFKTSSQRTRPDVKDQSTDIGECTRRHKGHEDALVLRLTDDIQTAYHSFKNSVAKHGNRPCMGYRPIVNGKAQAYQYFTYTQVYDRVLNLASGLRALGVQPNQHVGIFSKNRMEWQITSEACHTQSMVTIALYDTLGEESSLFIMNHGEIVCLLISAEVFPQVTKIAAQCKYLKNLIVFENLTENIKEECNKLGLSVRSFAEVEDLGKQARVSDVVPTADTLATIMYTSGTTGMPKGVMLTHKNIIAAVSGVTLTLVDITDQDVLISYLPLAHILERAAELVFFQNGACIGFTQGIIKEMLDDVQALRPTFFPAVPRVLDRFYDRIQGQVATSSKLRKWLFNKGIEGQKHKLANPGHGGGLFAKIVTGKMKKVLGGRVRGMLSGGAPLNPKVHEFLQCAFDCSIVQGYGLTETCAACTIQLPYDTGLAQIGPPLASCEVKLISVPEMNYLTTNEEPSGEILIRGGNVSSGYYKDEEKTREVFDLDGWFHTGDVGKFNKNGTLSVIDRVKNIFKLSQGEYVAVENLELRLLSPYLARIWIYGDSLKSQLISVGVVNAEVVQQYAKEHNIAGATIEEIIAKPEIKKMILADLDKKGKEVKLKGFEFVKNIHLVAKDFDTVDGTTPTMKLKRNVLKNVYQNELDQMYAELEKETPSA